MTSKAEMALPETGPRAAAAVLAVVVGLVGVTVTIEATRVGSRSDLTEVNRGTSLWTPGGRVVLRRAGVSGLRAGDEIVAIDGRTPAWWVEHRTPPPFERTGPPTFTYTVRPAYHGPDRQVEVRLLPAPLSRNVRANWPAIGFVLLHVTVAGWLFARRPRARAAQALLVSAGALPVVATGWVSGVTASDLAQGPGLALWTVAGLAFGLLWGATLHFALVFPDLHPLLRRRGWVVVGAYAAPFLLRAGFATAGLARADTDWQRVEAQAVPTATEQWILPLIVVAVLVSGHAAAKDRPGRAQLALVGATISAGLIAFVGLCIVPAALVGHPLLASELQPLLLVPVPIAIAAAVLRHRMLEIDVPIRRSVVWALLTGGVVGGYVGAVLLLNFLFASLLRLLSVQRPELLASLASTGVIAVIFQPTRQVLQAAVNRLAYGRRREPYQVLSELGQQVGAAAPPGAMLASAVGLIGRELQLARVSIELLEGAPIMWSAEPGRPASDPDRRPLTHQGTVVGYLAVSAQATGTPLPAADRRLLDDLARQLGFAAHAVQLTAALHRSRERLVAAREEERDHIHRDLHDGLGPTLAGIALQLDLAAGRLPAEQATTKEMLSQLHTETQKAITDVRRLVYGLRPPAVRELGLLAALRERAATYSAPGDDGRVRFTVAAGELPPLPIAVEVAAYRIAVEAMTNVIRHAHAASCTVRLELLDTLRLQVTDDGIGPPTPLTPGVGVSSMRARAAELGGSCQVRRGLAGGTEVIAALPVPATATGGRASGAAGAAGGGAGAAGGGARP